MKTIASRLLILGTLFLSAPLASAQTTCSNVDPATGTVSGATVSCTGTGSPYSGRIGAAASVATGAPTQSGITLTTGSGTSIGLDPAMFGPNTATINLLDGANITIGSNATVSAPNSGAGINNSAIYFRNGGTLLINSGASVINYATGGTGVPPINAGNNTIEFQSNNTVTINSGATVYAAGPATSSEAINPAGTGNTIDNSGTIKSLTGTAIWFQNSVDPGSSNTIINRASGIIQAGTGGQAIGASAPGSVLFDNYGTVLGGVSLATGSNRVTLYTGSSITGSINGGGGTNTLQFAGTGSSTFSNTTSNFQTLNKLDSGTWTLTNPLTAISRLATVSVQGGTLALQGDNSGFAGSTSISSGATLQGDALAIPGSTASGTTGLTNNGTIAFTDGGSASYSGVIAGTGGISMIGSGTLTLSGANTYAGDTLINSGGTLALADSGSITSSNLSTFTNNGTFDIVQKTANTNLSGNYVQTGTGALKMALNTSNTEKLLIAGTANIAGTLYVNANPGHYSAGRYTLINAQSGLTGTFSKFTNDFEESASKYRLGYDGKDVFLYLDTDYFEVDNDNTVRSVQINASGLASIYNQQVAAYQAALMYDCRVYDKNNVCVSVGGRYTYSGPSPSANQQAGLVVLGYKPSPNLRVGAFADQTISVATPSGFSQSNNSPMWGLFAKWHMSPDETGWGVQASGVASNSTLSITRPLLANTEAGSGSTSFNGQGYQLTTNYHHPVTDSFSVIPYVGLRYTHLNTGGYTEGSNANVTLPLSYNSLTQNTFSAIGGLGFRVGLSENLTGTASIGIQQNLKYSMNNYQVTSSIIGLESFSVAMPGNVNSMATASAGLFYDINKRERLGLNVLWQQQPFIATNTTTALMTYTIAY